MTPSSSSSGRNSTRSPATTAFRVSRAIDRTTRRTEQAVDTPRRRSARRSDWNRSPSARGPARKRLHRRRCGRIRHRPSPMPTTVRCRVMLPLPLTRSPVRASSGIRRSWASMREVLRARTVFPVLAKGDAKFASTLLSHATTDGVQSPASGPPRSRPPNRGRHSSPSSESQPSTSSSASDPLAEADVSSGLAAGGI